MYLSVQYILPVLYVPPETDEDDGRDDADSDGDGDANQHGARQGEPPCVRPDHHS